MLMCRDRRCQVRQAVSANTPARNERDLDDNMLQRMPCADEPGPYFTSYDELCRSGSPNSTHGMWCCTPSSSARHRVSRSCRALTSDVGSLWAVSLAGALFQVRTGAGAVDAVGIGEQMPGTGPGVVRVRECASRPGIITSLGL